MRGDETGRSRRGAAASKKNTEGPQKTPHHTPKAHAEVAAPCHRLADFLTRIGIQDVARRRILASGIDANQAIREYVAISKPKDRAAVFVDRLSKGTEFRGLSAKFTPLVLFPFIRDKIIAGFDETVFNGGEINQNSGGILVDGRVVLRADHIAKARLW